MEKKTKVPAVPKIPAVNTKKRKFNPDVIPVQAKTYATLNRTLRGTRK